MTGTTRTGGRAPTRSATTVGSPRSRPGGRGTGGRRRSPKERFEARRLDVERREGLRRLRLVLGLAAVTSLAVGVVAFVNSSWFDVDEISVSGNERSTTDEIVEASGIDAGDGLLEVDLDGAARSVELVPWVGTARVERSWLGSIRITVTERPPLAAIPAGSGFALVDEHGRQLEVVDQRPDGFLPIRGIQGSGQAGEAAPDEVLPVIALIEALPPETAPRVAAVAVLDGDIHLELVDGGLANLGDGSDLGRKLQAFETVLARVDLSCLDTVDVRVPEAPVVTRTAELPPLGPDGAVPGGGPASAPEGATVEC